MSVQPYIVNLHVHGAATELLTLLLPPARRTNGIGRNARPVRNCNGMAWARSCPHTLGGVTHAAMTRPCMQSRTCLHECFLWAPNKAAASTDECVRRTQRGRPAGGARTVGDVVGCAGHVAVEVDRPRRRRHRGRQRRDQRSSHGSGYVMLLRETGAQNACLNCVHALTGIRG